MPQVHLLCFAAGVELLQRVLADGFQEAETRFAVRHADPSQQAFVDQRGDLGLYAQRGIVGKSANCIDRLQRAATHKHPQPPEQRLLVLVQQLVAPVDRAAEGLLARGQVARPAGQEGKALPQPRQQRFGRK